MRFSDAPRLSLSRPGFLYSIMNMKKLLLREKKKDSRWCLNNNGGQAAALRISRSVADNLNIDSCNVVATPMHAPSRASLSSRHPPCTQYPFPKRSLVRSGETSRHTPRLVVSHCRVLHSPPSPHAYRFVIGPAVINNKPKSKVCSKSSRKNPGAGRVLMIFSGVCLNSAILG